MDNLTRKYFRMGFTQKEILLHLRNDHHILISPITLKRRLRKLHLFRRKNKTDLITLVKFIREELKASGQLLGYRWMHKRCIGNGFVVARQTVADIVKILDPEGVATRKKKRLRRRLYNVAGPNALWHCDGYDKIKPYGFAIHGGIDGFSRFMLWLEVGSTNNDPAVVAGYYASTIEELGGFPLCVRTDRGTENVYIKEIQDALKQKYNSDSSHPAHLYGTSPNNQRIEAFWGILRKQCIQHYMNIFQELKENGKFDGGEIDKGVLRYCFLALIQTDLNKIKNEWNYHRIRKSKNSISPGGRPVSMFEIPEEYQKKNCLIKIPGDDNDVIEKIKGVCRFEKKPCSELLFGLCERIRRKEKLEHAMSVKHAVALYLFLRKRIYNLVQMSADRIT